MKVSNALYTYPVLSISGLRDDYLPESSFSIEIAQVQTGVSETSLDISVSLEDTNLSALVNSGKAKITCHIESPLSSFRKVYDIDAFDMHIQIPINPDEMRGYLEVTPFIVANEVIDNFTSNAFSEFYEGKYYLERGDILAFAPTTEVEIEPDDIDKRPTQSIIRVTSHKERDMSIDLSGDNILIRLPEATYSGYRNLSSKASDYYAMSLMAIVLPALMAAIYDIKSEKADSDDKVWSRVIKAKLKNGGMGSNYDQYDPLAYAQFLLNNPAEDTFRPIINASDSNGGND